MNIPDNVKGALIISLGYLLMMVVPVFSAIYIRKIKEERRENTDDRTKQYDLVGRIIDSIFKD